MRNNQPGRPQQPAVAGMGRGAQTHLHTMCSPIRGGGGPNQSAVAEGISFAAAARAALGRHHRLRYDENDFIT